jgi:hypothetical protein
MFETVLTTDEWDRAGRFRFSYLRESFVIARSTIRCLLGRYIDLEPTDIRLIYGSKEKPALNAPTESAVLSSVSKFCEGQTQILISHRISSLAWVDRFVLLDRGRIVEMAAMKCSMRVPRIIVPCSTRLRMTLHPHAIDCDELYTENSPRLLAQMVSATGIPLWPIFAPRVDS